MTKKLVKGGCGTNMLKYEKKWYKMISNRKAKAFLATWVARKRSGGTQQREQ